MTSHIRTELDEGLFTIVLNRPDKKNALTVQMYDDLAAALRQVRDDDAIHTALIYGEGGTFTAGNDLLDFMQRPPESEDTPVVRFLKEITTTPKPIIAAVEGNAIGIGTTMLLHCDLVYVAQDTRFKMPFVSLGLTPEAASTYILPRIGGRLATELVYYGEKFGADEAMSIGLVTRIVEPGQAVQHATERARALTAQPIGALMDTKRLMRAGVEDGIRSALAREGELFMHRLKSPEAMEAFTAFFEKRPPDFKKLKTPTGA